MARNRIKSFRTRERDSSLSIDQGSTSRREKKMDSEREEEKKDMINPDITYIPEGQIIIIILPIEKHMQSKTMVLYPPCY